MSDYMTLSSSLGKGRPFSWEEEYGIGTPPPGLGATTPPSLQAQDDWGGLLWLLLGLM
jgi:hypothetical protein